MSEKPVGQTKVVRILLFVVLGVALVALTFDWNARRQAKAAYKLLESRDLESVGTSPDDVHRVLGREPDAPGKEQLGEMVEKFTYKGIRTYTLYVAYSRVVGSDSKASFTMDRTTLNEEP